jgi:hypothetical protein
VDRHALVKAVAGEDWGAARAMISHDVVRAHAATGNAEDCRRRYREYREAGLDLLIPTGIADGEEMRCAMDIAAAP